MKNLTFVSLLFSFILISSALADPRTFKLRRVIQSSAAHGSNTTHYLYEGNNQLVVWYVTTGSWKVSGKQGLIWAGHDRFEPLRRALENRWEPSVQYASPQDNNGVHAEWWESTCTVLESELPSEFQSAEYKAELDAKAAKAKADVAALAHANAMAAEKAAAASSAAAATASNQNALKAHAQSHANQVAAMKAQHSKMIQLIQSGHSEQVDALKKVIKDLCFPAETFITVKDSRYGGKRSVPISDIHIGDSVLSCNIQLSGLCEFRQVKEVFRNSAEHLIRLRFAGNELRATDNHPFYVVNRMDWVAAKDLQVGDHLQNSSGDTVALEGIDSETGEFDVYNLDVERNHNYFAGDVLVHNCNRLGEPVPDETDGSSKGPQAVTEPSTKIEHALLQDSFASPDAQKLPPAQPLELMYPEFNLDIISTAGTQYLHEVLRHKMLPRGSAVITGAGSLRRSGIREIIHAATGSLSDRYGPAFEPTVDSVRNSLRNSLILAKRFKHARVAIPFIGGKIFARRIGVERDELARTIIHAALKFRNGIEICFVLPGKADFDLFNNLLSEFTQDRQFQSVGTAVVAVQGSIVDYSDHHASAIINAANMELKFRGGISGVIAAATDKGPNIEKFARSRIKAFNRVLLKAKLDL